MIGMDRQKQSFASHLFVYRYSVTYCAIRASYRRKVQASDEGTWRRGCAKSGDKKEVGSGGEELEKVFEGCTDPCSLIVNI